MTMNKILIVEDEENIRMMLAYDLKQYGYEVITSSDGDKGYQLAMSNDFDVIILDVLLPKRDGREVCSALKSEGIKSYILMLSALDDEMDKIRGFEYGADDYMTKPFSPRELTAKIKAILRREQVSHESPVVREYKDICIDVQNYSASLNNNLLILTLKEYELLKYFVFNNNIVLSREKILSTIWGYSYDGDSRVVDVHISKIRDKLNASTVMIETIRGVGYKMK